MGCAWYRKIPYISEEKPKGYLVIPRQNKKAKAVCIPIRKAALKIYIMNNPNFVGMYDTLARFIFRDTEVNNFYTPLNGMDKMSVERRNHGHYL